jgi:helix-turn-helix protein
MGQVFDHVLSASEQLVLLALADHADHNGENAYPSLELLAYKAGLTKRGVRKILRRLEARAILVEQRPPGHHLPRTYRIVLASAPRKEGAMGERRSSIKGAPRSSMKGERRDLMGERRDLMEEQMRSPEPSSLNRPHEPSALSCTACGHLTRRHELEDADGRRHCSVPVDGVRCRCVVERRREAIA